ncbi:hypothetical protein OH77DRAFT_1367691, partial [Trametes cingulata]
MRIDGTTCPDTHIDEETGSIILRRLHPRIASYNDLVIFLMKCNMDIKFIGSGEAAKALLYYITDYITKPSLPVHVGLGALSYAIQKASEKFPSNADYEASLKSRGALTLTVNRMLSRQEISHQQVMSYLVGGGDFYTSHTFRTLYWGAFDRLFKKDNLGNENDAGNISDDTMQDDEAEETFVLNLQPTGSISAVNQQQDYMLRSTDPAFDKLSLYEFVGLVEKVKRSETRLQTGDDMNTRGRTSEPRGLFSSREHTQYNTHMLRLRTKWIVPVVLGDRVPRCDRGEEERNAWARMMLILFVPWRKPSDLRETSESWTVAFERQRYKISARCTEVIANMNVLTECRDARDSFREMRRADALALIRSGLPMDISNEHTGVDEDEIHQEFQLFDRPDFIDAYEYSHELSTSRKALDDKVGEKTRELLDSCYGARHTGAETSSMYPASSDIHTSSVNLQSVTRQRIEDDEPMLLEQAAIMRTLKKHRRPGSTEEDENTRPRKKRKTFEVIENITQTQIGGSTGLPQSNDEIDFLSRAMEQVSEEMKLRDNPEQERAFKIVCDHLKTSTDQLLMYIAGVGGTGKTHVVRSILKLFELLGR